MKNLYLIGPMGVGKTTVGKYLASLLNYEFFDADIEIEKKTGASISWIFDKEGEQGFRERELKMTRFLCKKSDIVLATGGGVVLSQYNREILARTGYVVFLTANVDTLIKRTSKDKNRPLLQKENPNKIIKQILNERTALYQSIADFTIISNENTAQEMAQKIYNKFIEFNK